MIRDHKNTIYQMLSFIINTFQELPSYITVKVQKTWMATRFSAFLDYGQGMSNSQQEMTDAVKKALFFKSKVEIYNLLDRNG